MASERTSILIVEDDLDVADMLRAYLQAREHDVLTVHGGEAALRACSSQRPNLIILDIRLPDIDGYEVARRLRHNRRTADIPIIFLTERRAREDRLLGFEIGADDYVTKPYDMQELHLRVRNALRRSVPVSLINPVTGLPEVELVDERLLECLHEDDWALILVSLENIDVFREEYGFVASNDVLKAVGLMISNAARGLGTPNDFIGHLQKADFVLVTAQSNSAVLQDRILQRIESSLDYFYPQIGHLADEQLSPRLGVKVTNLMASQGPFTNLADLKTHLIQGGH